MILIINDNLPKRPRTSQVLGAKKLCKDMGIEHVGVLDGDFSCNPCAKDEAMALITPSISDGDLVDLFKRFESYSVFRAKFDHNNIQLTKVPITKNGDYLL